MATLLAVLALGVALLTDTDADRTRAVAVWTGAVILGLVAVLFAPRRRLPRRRMPAVLWILLCGRALGLAILGAWLVDARLPFHAGWHAAQSGAPGAIEVAVLIGAGVLHVLYAALVTPCILAHGLGHAPGTALARHALPRRVGRTAVVLALLSLPWLVLPWEDLWVDMRQDRSHVGRMTVISLFGVLWIWTRWTAPTLLLALATKDPLRKVLRRAPHRGWQMTRGMGNVIWVGLLMFGGTHLLTVDVTHPTRLSRLVTTPKPPWTQVHAEAVQPDRTHLHAAGVQPVALVGHPAGSHWIRVLARTHREPIPLLALVLLSIVLGWWMIRFKLRLVREAADRGWMDAPDLDPVPERPSSIGSVFGVLVVLGGLTAAGCGHAPDPLDDPQVHLAVGFQDVRPGTFHLRMETRRDVPRLVVGGRQERPRIDRLTEDTLPFRLEARRVVAAVFRSAVPARLSLMLSDRARVPIRRPRDAVRAEVDPRLLHASLRLPANRDVWVLLDRQAGAAGAGAIAHLAVWGGGDLQVWPTTLAPVEVRSDAVRGQRVSVDLPWRGEARGRANEVAALAGHPDIFLVGPQDEDLTLATFLEWSATLWDPEVSLTRAELHPVRESDLFQTPDPDAGEVHLVSDGPRLAIVGPEGPIDVTAWPGHAFLLRARVDVLESADD